MATTTFEPNVAAELAQIAYLVYRDEQAFVRGITSTLRHDWDVAFIERLSCEVGMLRCDERKVAVLAFRGTEKDEWGDIRADLNVDKVDDPYLPDGCQVQEGFKNELDRCWAQIERWVNEIPLSFKLYTTGHSLGGALATLCALRLPRATDHSAPICYTFGSPRVGNTAFSRLGGAHFRIRNNNDKITNIYTQVVLGYKHHGQQIYIASDGELHFQLGWWQRCADWARGHWRAVRNGEWIDSFKDHRMERYVRALGLLLPESDDRIVRRRQAQYADL
jgi:triacylglycerol lipase